MRFSLWGGGSVQVAVELNPAEAAVAAWTYGSAYRAKPGVLCDWVIREPLVFP